MKLNYFINVPGKPLPKSVKFSRFGSYNSKHVRGWMDLVRDITKVEMLSKKIVMPPGTPVKVFVTAYLPLPKSTAKIRIPLLVDTWHTVKPDADNLLKPKVDGMTEAEMWDDDNQVASMKIEKLWCERGNERAEVSVMW